MSSDNIRIESKYHIMSSDNIKRIFLVFGPGVGVGGAGAGAGGAAVSHCRKLQMCLLSLILIRHQKSLLAEIK